MAMSFEAIPPNALVPLVKMEVRPSPEPINEALRILLVGWSNVGEGAWRPGFGDDNTPQILTRDAAVNLYGLGSMLHWMYDSARGNAPWAEIWGISVPPETDAIRASGSIQVVRTPNAVRQGFLGFSVAGRTVRVRVIDGDTRETVALKIRNGINQQALPVRAIIDPLDETRINLFCRWMGGSGNEIIVTSRWFKIRTNLGSDTQLFEWLCNPHTQSLNGGDGNRVTASTIPYIGDMPFDVIIIPNRGLTDLGHWRQFMDHISGRWSPFRQLYGHVFMARRTNFTGLYNLAADLNDPHVTIMGYTGSAQPSWEWSAAMGATAAIHWSAPPELSRPLQTLSLRGIFANTESTTALGIPFDETERQILLQQGISTYTVGVDRQVRIERLRTLRKLNPHDDPDPSWADAITLFQAMYTARWFRRALTGAYPRNALSTRPTGIPGITSPSEIKGTLIHAYKDLASVGLVENVDLFIRALVVERDPVDRNRVNILMKPDFVNQLRILAVIMETHLELIEEGQIANVAQD